MKKFNCILVLGIFLLSPAVIGIFSSSLFATIYCNKQVPAGTQSPCNSDYPADAYCAHWSRGACSGHLGAADGNGASTWKACGGGGGSADDCITDDVNCLEKKICRWIDNTQGCMPGNSTSPSTYLQATVAQTRSCTPEVSTP